MEDIHARFAELLPPLLARHGIAVVGRWTTRQAEAPENFAYLTQFADLATREASWAGFYADPEWPQVRAVSNRGADMVLATSAQFLRGSAKPAKPIDQLHAGPLQQLCNIEMAVGLVAQAAHYLTDRILPIIQEHGGEVLLHTDYITGEELPKMAMFIGWQHRDQSEQAVTALRDSSILAHDRREQIQIHGRPLVELRSVTDLVPGP